MDSTEFKRLINALPALPPSPFHQFFDTNYTPSDLEISEIRFLVQNVKTQLALLDNYREQLSHYIDKHAALASPIRRIPDDILREIFIASLPRTPTFSSTEPPHTLGWVCRRWREVALSTQRLWSTVYVSMPCESNPAADRLARLRCSALQTWIERSNPIPIRLWLVDYPSGIAQTFLQPFTHRIGELRQELYEPNHSTFLLQLGRFQNLRSVSVVNEAEEEDVAVLCDPELLVRAPNLEAISCRGMASSPFQYALNWSRMTTFRWTTHNRHAFLSNEQVLRLLESMPSLRVCRIGQFNAPRPRNEDAQVQRVIALPQLQVLCLYQSEGGPMTVSLLCHVDAPLLHRLSFSFVPPISLRSTPIKAQLLRRVEVLIESYTSKEIIDLISSMDSLEDLILKYRPFPIRSPPGNMSDDEWTENYGFNDGVLKALTPTNDDPNSTLACPRLHSLEIDDFMVDRPLLTTEAFMAFIIERSRHPKAQTCLARIQLRSPGYVPGLRAALQTWMQAGNNPVKLVFSGRENEEIEERPRYPQDPPNTEVFDDW
ncbi:hypothetical protein CC1G_09079 [Coprinopsis cinerea okayama7|uniref:Uncharacterized protein n=1 Tax=Coprinopsis cinerea (strain Okayama-7 / 130 / ATCC MYA-4618 / FGSC 9003) TaxID=240176 RepID=A8P321_COPC7|nr:hypothetical protein CC1G_09079 [Coprinopsis cinerea okayama7\|eukprot:XP_001838451.2 hypothetical protein CC1G_09079 [Coprinopsis cinerea okayama7\